MDSRVITEADIGKALDILISRESSVYIAMWGSCGADTVWLTPASLEAQRAQRKIFLNAFVPLDALFYGSILNYSNDNS